MSFGQERNRLVDSKCLFQHSDCDEVVANVSRALFRVIRDDVLCDSQLPRLYHLTPVETYVVDDQHIRDAQAHLDHGWVMHDLVGKLCQHERVQWVEPDRVTSDGKVILDRTVYVCVAVGSLIHYGPDVGGEVFYEAALRHRPDRAIFNRAHPEPVLHEWVSCYSL